MGKLSIFTMRLASLLVLQAAGAGLASPTVLVTRPVSKVPVEWLPIDNQTVYRLAEGESRSLELNTTSMSQTVVFITISPCSRDIHWALYYGKIGNNNGQLSLQKENGSGEISTFSLNILSQHEKYVIVLSSTRGGAAVVSVRGEATRQVRMRLRVRSRRRLAANWEPRKLSIFTMRLASLLVLQAAGAGLASPTVLVTRPVSKVPVEWLPIDNQTVYRLAEGESRSLELNTTSMSQTVVFITISPCSRDIHWALYYGKIGNNNGQLSLQKENGSGEISTFSLNILSQHEKYVIVLSSTRGGAAVVSVRGEATRQVRMRLRVRSRRRLAANWEPSPIDPQATTYCVVASHRKNYTSLCAAQHDIKTSRMENKSNRLNHDDGKTTQRLDNGTRFSILTDVDNKINIDADNFNMYDGNFNNVFRRKKFGRSTKVTDEDPVIACVGGRTHHLIENLDPSTTYFVSVFGVAKDRRSGSLLATGSVRPRTSTAKRLKENMPSKADIRGRNVFYFKATVGTGGGLWLTVTTCGGAVDVEVLVRGKRLHMARNIDPQAKFFVPAPISSTSIQETSDEGSIQFDSSSEETRMRYVIKVVPSRWDRDGTVGIELTASTARWGVGTPELTDGASIVRELRPKRSCRSVDVAFLPATHNATDVIRYCILAREIMSGEVYVCWSNRKSSLMKSQCTNHGLKSAKVIRQKITGLKAGRKYAIQVIASNKGYTIPYNILYVDTNISCKED